MAAFVKRVHQGLAYGDGHLQGAGSSGQVVRLVGHDLFAVNTDPTQPSFGVLIRDYKDGEMPGILCNGGIIELTTYEGNPAPGDTLKVSATGFLTPNPGAGEYPLARVISVANGVLKIKLLV